MCWPDFIGTNTAIAKQFSMSFSQERDALNEPRSDPRCAFVVPLRAGL